MTTHASHPPSSGDGGVVASAAAPIPQALVTERILLSALREQDAADSAHAARRRAEFLSEASRRFGATLDEEQTYAIVADLALPALDAWCIVDIVEATGSLRRLAIRHSNAGPQQAFRDRIALCAPSLDDPFGVPLVMHDRRSVMLPSPAHDSAAPLGRSGVRDALHALAPGPMMVVPMVAHGVLFGAVTYVGASSVRGFTVDDTQLAESVAERCAQALEGARAFSVARAAIAAADAALAEAEAARAVAESAGHIKDKFLAMVSHELRSPLAGIASNVQMLLLGYFGPINERQRESLTRTMAGEEHMLSLVEQLLAVKRLEAGEMVFDVAPVQVCELLQSAVSLVVGQFERLGIALAVDIGVGSCVLETDGGKLKQIVINLLSNAVKFTPAAGRVTLTARVVGPQVRIAVQDTGIGIDAAHQESVFLPFMQVRDGRQPNLGGTGLGLAISREFARGLGGDVTLESSPGAGSTFTLLLPAPQPS